MKKRKKVNKKEQTLIKSPSFFLMFLFIGVMIVFLVSRTKQIEEQKPLPLIFDEEWPKYFTSLNKLKESILGELPQTPWE